ncbi:hypothetical protein IPU75_08420 [Ochrobactrum sp. SD129]|nr:hypothetical protein [Ochrobactrum sp. SD129]
MYTKTYKYREAAQRHYGATANIIMTTRTVADNTPELEVRFVDASVIADRDDDGAVIREKISGNGVVHRVFGLPNGDYGYRQFESGRDTHKYADIVFADFFEAWEYLDGVVSRLAA